jgi:hypothetical protein
MLPPAFNGRGRRCQLSFASDVDGEQMTDCGRLTAYSLCHSVNQCPTPVLCHDQNHTLFFLATATTDEKTHLDEQEGKSKQQRSWFGIYIL